MNKEEKTAMSKLPAVERGSFWHPYQYSPEALKRRDEILKKKRETTTTYFEYKYDDDGNCQMIPHPYEDRV